MEEMLQVSASTRGPTAASTRSSHPAAPAAPSLCLELKSGRDENGEDKNAEPQTAFAGIDTKRKFLKKLTEVSPRWFSCKGLNSSARILSDSMNAKASVPVGPSPTATITLCATEPVRRKMPSPPPPLDIPVFSGDPLKYLSFIGEFQHFVESKTLCNTERLRYMLQLTSGDPRELVRSCLHLHAEHAYHKAKALLKKHYGKSHHISAAYTDKALSWPAIPPADGRALLSLGLFLKEWRRVMTELRRARELERSPLTQAVVAKLPPRLRDRWGSRVRGIKREEKRAAQFSDLVDFVNSQAQAALELAYSHPLDSAPRDRRKQRREPESGRLQRKSGGRRRLTAASASQPGDPPAAAVVCAFSLPCLYCRGGGHAMERCGAMNKVPHKEKMRFLRVKGLCFSCLRQGHTSSSCQERVSCKACAQAHHTLLHAARTQVEPAVETRGWREPSEAAQRSPQTFLLFNFFISVCNVNEPYLAFSDIFFSIPNS